MVKQEPHLFGVEGEVRDYVIPDSIALEANMGPTWVLSAPDGPHVGPMNPAIRDGMETLSTLLNSLRGIHRVAVESPHKRPVTPNFDGSF